MARLPPTRARSSRLASLPVQGYSPAVAPSADVCPPVPPAAMVRAATGAAIRRALRPCPCVIEVRLCACAPQPPPRAGASSSSIRPLPPPARGQTPACSAHRAAYTATSWRATPGEHVVAGRAAAHGPDREAAPLACRTAPHAVPEHGSGARAGPPHPTRAPRPPRGASASRRGDAPVRLAGVQSQTTSKDP